MSSREIDLQVPPPLQHVLPCPHRRGGPQAKPGGEVTLAHRGILFLDELPEFGRKTLESLRLPPLEDKRVTISRVNQTNRYPPSDFMLVAAMNPPCPPCGYAGTSRCECTPPYAIRTYRQRISGPPILDRIDMQKYVGRVEFKDGHLMKGNTSSKDLRNSVMERVSARDTAFGKGGRSILPPTPR